MSGLMAIILAKMNRKWSKEDKNDEKMEILINCLSVIMVDNVRRAGKDYVQQKEITLEEKESIEEMYTVYGDLRKEKQDPKDKLGTIMQEVRRLPVVNR